MDLYKQIRISFVSGRIWIHNTPKHDLMDQEGGSSGALRPGGSVHLAYRVPTSEVRTGAPTSRSPYSLKDFDCMYVFLTKSGMDSGIRPEESKGNCKLIPKLNVYRYYKSLLEV